MNKQMIAGYRPRYKEGFRRVDSANRAKAEADAERERVVAEEQATEDRG